MSTTKTKTENILFPTVSAVTIYNAKICIMTADGEIITHGLTDRFSLSKITNNSTILTCHAPWVAKKLELNNHPAFDVLELFAFCNPAKFITPTIHGLAKFLELNVAQDVEDTPFLLIDICQTLLNDLQKLSEKEKKQCISIAMAMGRQNEGWAWTPYVLSALGIAYDHRIPTNPMQDIDIFDDLKEWSEEAPLPPNKFEKISDVEATDHLKILLQRRQSQGKNSEVRTQQQEYATNIANHLIPKRDEESPNLLIAQAGTGIGKTFGYLSPAQLWSEKNEGRITISTYTKNLQRQIEQDLSILYPDKAERERKAVIQKGRENYLCLLNFENMISSSALSTTPHLIISAGLIARWIMATPDGDLSGNSFPGWLGSLLGIQNTIGLSDRRGECIYAACHHYHKCFIEGMNRKAKRAKIVINNHALTLNRAATQAVDAVTPFIIFDEAHHLTNAADSTYGADLTGIEAADLRRWLIGPEDENRKNRASSRGRGLLKRLDGLIDEGSNAYSDISKIIVIAKECLPAPRWRARVFSNDPFGSIEYFLSAIASHVNQRAKNPNIYYSIECDVSPVTDNLIETANTVLVSLKKLRKPLSSLSNALKDMLEDKADDLDKDTMARIDSLSSSIEYRVDSILSVWINMLENITSSEPAKETFVDWFEINRMDGRNFDCGYIRRFKNPMEPFGNSFKHLTHGMVMTSATLRTKKGEEVNDWVEADQALGVKYLTNNEATKIDLASPFEYEKQSKIFIVTGIDKNNGIEVANAYKAIFEVSKGGGLGLFTSINRLKQVNKSIKDALERKSISVYAQHDNDIDIGTLTDMFKEDENSCLLGTDAIRDGIDIVGNSCRCIVFDKVPWPRPTILHRERKKIFGGRAYDENLTRLKLKQAYGRLIRSQTDKGVFVILDGAMPSRLLDAFPENVEIKRQSLKDTIKDIKEFI